VREGKGVPSALKKRKLKSGFACGGKLSIKKRLKGVEKTRGAGIEELERKPGREATTRGIEPQRHG